ncbi:MAG: DUF1653 domain-containing protein [Candidatus Doudnabacteria bacterium]|nr:DUF1653 domain-containing protein [Candidatus Doudnabacteria bacterium]
MEIEPGIYLHFKGNKYKVIGMVKHSETNEDLVLYEALYENPTSKFWVRPANMFLEEVLVNGEKTLRFKKLL